MSDAIESQGFYLEIGDGESPETMIEVKEITGWNGPDGQASEIDKTHTRSPAKEFGMGLQDNGNFSIDTNFLPKDPGQNLMRTAKATRQLQNFKANYSDGSTEEFQGFVLSATKSGGVDAKVDGSFTIRITGAVTFTPAGS